MFPLADDPVAPPAPHPPSAEEGCIACPRFRASSGPSLWRQNGPRAVTERSGHPRPRPRRPNSAPVLVTGHRPSLNSPSLESATHINPITFAMLAAPRRAISSVAISISRISRRRAFHSELPALPSVSSPVDPSPATLPVEPYMGHTLSPARIPLSELTAVAIYLSDYLPFRDVARPGTAHPACCSHTVSAGTPPGGRAGAGGGQAWVGRRAPFPPRRCNPPWRMA